jgi:hypothetical protein
MNVRELLNECGVDGRDAGQHHHVTDGFYGVDCPTCSPGAGAYRLGISLRGRAATCWICGRLPYVDTLAEVTGKPVGWILANLDRSGPPQAKVDKPRGVLRVPPQVGPLLPAHRKYLKFRGFDPDEIVETWGVGGIGNFAGNLSWRLYIPIHQGGKVVSWTTRSIADMPGWPSIVTGSLVRYRNAPDRDSAVSARDVLYGADKCRHAVIVVEGQLDAWAIGPGAVAVGGLGASMSQIAKIAKFPVRVLCLDSSPEGARENDMFEEWLRSMPGETIRVTLETGKDAASADKSEVEELRAFLR